MKKILISEVVVTKPPVNINYYLLEDGKNYGVEISKTPGETEFCFVPGTFRQVKGFIFSLAKNVVMPIHLQDCAEDYIKENFSLKLST